MRIILGAVIGAVASFLIVDRLVLPLKTSILFGLFLWAATPIVGAIVGGYCSYRIRWAEKSVVLKSRLVAIGAALGGTIDLILPFDNYLVAPLTDVLNSSLRFLYGGVVGGLVCFFLGHLIYRRMKNESFQATANHSRETTEGIWPPPPSS